MRLTIATAAFCAALATGAVAQTRMQEAEIAPGVPALGIETGPIGSLALMTPAADPMAYTDMLQVGSVGSPGVVAFALHGMDDGDLATGSLAPASK